MNYERYRQAIDTRTSNRRFTGATLTDEELSELRKLVDEYNGESGLSMQLVVGDNAPFEEKQASGMFQGTTGYLALIGKADDADRMEKEGYYGERFVLEATSMGIGTCWVASSFDKTSSKAEVGADEVLDLAIVFGKAEKKPSMKEKMIRKVLGDKRSPADIAPNLQEAPDWFRSGVEMAMKVPSTKNTKPFSFAYANGKATVQTVGDHERVMVDLGIAKLHFEVGAGDGKWELGNNASYVLGK